MDRPKRALAAALVVAGLALAGCSPEAARVRGGGPGGDVGNRDRAAEIHGPLDMYFKTPNLGGPAR